MSNLRWWDNNGFTQTAYDASRVSYSSSKSGFTGENAVKDLRTQVWRPGGNFDITTSNNKVYIESTTATITVGSYTYSTLATEIQTQLNTADSGWTVTYSTTTLKFTLAASGSKSLDLSSDTNAIWDTIGYVGSMDRSGTSFEADEIRIHTSEWIKIDFGLSFSMTCAGIISPLASTFPLTSSATVTLEANSTDSFTSPPFSQEISRYDRGVFGFIDDLYSEVNRTYRYALLRIEDRLNPLGPEGIEISRVYIGDHTTTTSNVGSGFSKPIVDPSTVQRSESGAAYFQEKTKYQAIRSANYGLIEQADRVALEQLYQDHGKTKPLWLSVDPSAAVSVDVSEFTFYGHFESDPNIQNLFRDKWSWQFNFREAV